MSDKPTDVSHGSNVPSNVGQTAVDPKEGEGKAVLPPGEHYWTDEFGTRHISISASAFARSNVSVDLLVYKSTANTFSAPEQQAAVLALEPKIRALPELLVVAIGHGEEPAGPHLGNPNLPEGTLKPLVANDLVRRRAAREHRRWIVSTLIVTPLLIILGWILNEFFSKSSP